MGLEVDFSKVEAELQSLQRKARGQVIHESLRAGADIVEDEIKKEIRSNDHIEHEILYNSIKPTKLHIRGTSSWIRVGIDPQARNPYSFGGKRRKEPRPVTIYGFVLEHGTKWKAGTHWMTNAKNRSFEPSRDAIARELKKRLGL